MSTQVESNVVESAAVKPFRTCKPKLGQHVHIVWPDGSACDVYPATGKAATKPEATPEVKPTEAKQADSPAPRKGGFRKAKATAPIDTPPATAPVNAKPLAPAAEATEAAAPEAAAPADSSAKQSARSAGQSTWVDSVLQDDKFKGLATFITKNGPKDVAILGKGDKKYKVGWLMETKKGNAYCWKKSVFFVALNDARLIDIELF